MNKLINPYHNRMLITSSLFFLCALIASYNNLNHIFLIDLLLFITSINYWRYPLKDYRRILDMLTVFIVILFHINIININYILIVPIMLLYISCKIINNYNITSLMHCLMHILVVILFITNYDYYYYI